MAVDRYVKAVPDDHRPGAVLDWRQGHRAAGRRAGAGTGTPTQVIIRGIQIPAAQQRIPAGGVVGQPVRVDVTRPVKIEADRPIKIEADRALKVENVGYIPAKNPGE